MLGVLMMVPLRRYLIVKEHGVAPLPRGQGLRRDPPRRVSSAGRRRRRSSSASASARLFKAFQAAPRRREERASRSRSTRSAATRSPTSASRELGCRRRPRAPRRRLHHRLPHLADDGGGEHRCCRLSSSIPMIVLIRLGPAPIRSSPATTPDPRSWQAREPSEIYKYYVKHDRRRCAVADGRNLRARSAHCPRSCPRSPQSAKGLVRRRAARRERRAHRSRHSGSRTR